MIYKRQSYWRIHHQCLLHAKGRRKNDKINGNLCLEHFTQRLKWAGIIWNSIAGIDVNKVQSLYFSAKLEQQHKSKYKGSNAFLKVAGHFYQLDKHH